MPTRIQLKHLRYFHGIKHGMKERTAIAVLVPDGHIQPDLVQALMAAETFAHINPGDPIRGIDPHRWWEGLLVSAPGDAQLPHLIAALAVAMQIWAGEPVGRSQVLRITETSTSLVLPWVRQSVAMGALEQALKFVAALSDPTGDKGKEFQGNFNTWLKESRYGGVSPTTLRFARAALARNWPVQTFGSLIMIGWGANAFRIAADRSDQTSTLAASLSSDRRLTTALLQSQQLPVISYGHAQTLEQARKAADRLGWPVTITAPEPGKRDKAITGIKDDASLKLAFETLQERASSGLIIENTIHGSDHRLLVINRKMLAAIRFLPDGTTEDVTHNVHPDNCLAAESSARMIGMNIAEVRLVCPDISRSWRDTAGTICKVNDLPNIHPHWFADTKRDMAGDILDQLYESGTPFIPTAAIGGTNGKTTTTMMLHHIWMATGKTVGVNTTSGTWIGKNKIDSSNLSGNGGAKVQLGNPDVEAAVIEMPRKGLMTLGHPCVEYDVAALLNIQDDHIGVDGINSLDEMAALKGQILERARDAIVLNAEDPRCLAAGARSTAHRRILFAQSPKNDALQEHLSNGGSGVFTADHDGVRWMVLAEGGVTHPLLPVSEIPATMGGNIRHNIENAMAATGLAWAQGIDRSVIKTALETFTNSPEMNPGRYNLIDGFPFQLILDYAHNPGSVEETVNAIKSIELSGRRILVSARIGNRHRDHFRQLAPALASSFDQFVLSCESRPVLRNPEFKDQPEPLQAAVDYYCEQLADNGVAPERIALNTNPETAILQALELAEPDDLVVILARPEFGLPALQKAKDRGF